MATRLRGVRPKGNRIEVTYSRAGTPGSFTIAKKPTQTNLQWASRNRGELIDGHLRGHTGTFDYYAELYLNTAKLELSTRMSYADALDIYWNPKLAGMVVEEIRYSTLLEIDESTEWTSAKTRKNAIAPLRGVFALAYKDLRTSLKLSPAHQLELGKHQTTPPDPFTRDERARVMAWMEKEERGVYFRAAFATGMRTGELIGLRWSAYDGSSFEVSESRVRGVNKESTKTHKVRKVLLPSWLCRELNNHPTRFKGESVFVNQYGRPYQKGDKLNIMFRRCLEELNIRPRTGPYPWRHTYACIGITEGLEPAFLAKQLGHSLETFYRTYAAWISADRDEEQRQKLEKTWKDGG